ncbi:hypothetical protein [Candidatus Poriferisodalis sp.]|uniref:hypothetical protein n=1 Tax=Candidatus Poriferisodalis sp. TaxID=3101277 RepID=UPI003C70516F
MALHAPPRRACGRTFASRARPRLPERLGAAPRAFSFATRGCHTRADEHCPSGEHEHTHGAGDCHTSTPADHHCDGTEHKHGTYNCHTSTPDNHHCETGEHEHTHGSDGCHTSTPDNHHDVTEDGCPVQWFPRGAGWLQTHRHSNAYGGAMSSCHRPSVLHCAEDHHEHVHGSGACHLNNLNTPSTELHCPDGHHEHEHGSGTCHQRTDPHCEGGTHHHPLRSDPDSTWCHLEGLLHCDSGEHFHDGLGCHTFGVNACTGDLHEHPEWSGCHDPDLQHHHQISQIERAIWDGSSILICGGLQLIPSWLTQGLGALCPRAMDAYSDAVEAEIQARIDAHDAISDPPTTEPDTSTSNYCSEWSGFGFLNGDGDEIGEVVLYENGEGANSYQGTRPWAENRCQIALTALD